MVQILQWIRRLWEKEPEVPHPHNRIRRTVDTDVNTIKNRLANLGFQVKEIPIRRNHPDVDQRTVLHWKVIAVKGEQSYEMVAPNLDEAIKNMGKSLGVIANE